MFSHSYCEWSCFKHLLSQDNFTSGAELNMMSSSKVLWLYMKPTHLQSRELHSFKRQDLVTYLFETKQCVRVISDSVYLLCWRVLGSSGRFSALWDRGTGPCLPEDILPWRGGNRRREWNENKDKKERVNYKQKETFIYSSNCIFLCYFLVCATHPRLWGCDAARVQAQQRFLVALWRAVPWRDVWSRWWCIRRQRDGRLTGVLSWNRKTEWVRRKRGSLRCNI